MLIVGSINDNLLFFWFTIMNGQRSHVSDVLVDSYGKRGPLLRIGKQETARAVLIAKVAANRCHIFEGSIPATKRNAPLGSTQRWIVHQRQITSRCGQELLFHGIVERIALRSLANGKLVNQSFPVHLGGNGIAIEANVHAAAIGPGHGAKGLSVFLAGNNIPDACLEACMRGDALVNLNAFGYILCAIAFNGSNHLTAHIVRETFIRLAAPYKFLQSRIIHKGIAVALYHIAAVVAVNLLLAHGVIF